MINELYLYPVRKGDEPFYTDENECFKNVKIKEKITLNKGNNILFHYLIHMIDTIAFVGCFEVEISSDNMNNRYISSKRQIIVKKIN